MSQLNSYMKTRSLDKDRVWVIYSWSHEGDAITKAKYRWFQCVDSHGPKDIWHKSFLYVSVMLFWRRVMIKLED